MRIYLDMDGVIVNMRDGIVNLYGQKFLDELDASQTTDTDLWEHVHRVCGTNFWADLDWMPDGQDILTALEERFGRANISLCTKPTKYASSLDGKHAWIKSNLPAYTNAYIMVREKERVAHSDALLIDDSRENVFAFRDAGGKALLVPRPWNQPHDSSFQISDTLPYLIKQLKGALAKA